ncbi:MAG TPA: carboxypeptidase-like regulatory domain-containing protein, partial [Flavobacterium sp.]|nr:carboxypeptidase-like regulatory domain-containing protein [Flavobacterium sp.]
MTIKKHIVSFLTILLLALNGYAQERVTVTGVVRDNTGSIPSATVIVMNQNASTTTDMDGKFSVKVNDPKTAVLLIKFIGMNDVTVPLKGR